MAKTRRDNQLLALRRRLKILQRNHSSIYDEWPQVTAADLLEDFIAREKRDHIIVALSARLAQADFHLVLTIVSAGMPNAARAAQLGFATHTELRNALRRIRTAAKSILRQLPETDDGN